MCLVMCSGDTHILYLYAHHHKKKKEEEEEREEEEAESWIKPLDGKPEKAEAEVASA